jgi:hypothetical protein
MTACSRASPSPDSLDRAIQHELTAQATLEADHCSACCWLDEWSGPKAVKEHVACRLEARHRTEREADVLRLAELHQQRMALTVSETLRGTNVAVRISASASAKRSRVWEGERSPSREQRGVIPLGIG